MHGRANTRHHVFALRIDQEIAVENLLAGGRVAREADSRSGVFAGVAENHLHHVDGRAQQPRNLLHAAVGDGLFRHPGTEHRADRSPQLLFGILREIALPVFSLKYSLYSSTSSRQPSAAT